MQLNTFLCLAAAATLAFPSVEAKPQRPRKFEDGLNVRLINASLATPASEATINARIVGGAATAAKPWLGVLVYPEVGTGYMRVYCACTLVGSQWVLTAAHCLKNVVLRKLAPPLAQHQVWLGGSNIDTGSTFIAHGISQTFSHPQHVLATHQNDIALIRLTQISGARPVTLTADLSFEAVGKNAIVTGWGATRDGGAMTSTPNQVAMPIQSATTCAVNDPDYRSNMHLCAGLPTGGKDSCGGDSGGPMWVGTDAAPTQLGIVSYGYVCAAAGQYGVYTRLSSYNTWIKSTMATAAPAGTWSSWGRCSVTCGSGGTQVRTCTGGTCSGSSSQACSFPIPCMEAAEIRASRRYAAYRHRNSAMSLQTLTGVTSLALCQARCDDVSQCTAVAYVGTSCYLKAVTTYAPDTYQHTGSTLYVVADAGVVYSLPTPPSTVIPPVSTTARCGAYGSPRGSVCNARVAGKGCCSSLSWCGGSDLHCYGPRTVDSRPVSTPWRHFDWVNTHARVNMYTVSGSKSWCLDDCRRRCVFTTGCTAVAYKSGVGCALKKMVSVTADITSSADGWGVSAIVGRVRNMPAV